jgi:hypothetical protein
LFDLGVGDQWNGKTGLNRDFHFGFRFLVSLCKICFPFQAKCLAAKASLSAVANMLEAAGEGTKMADHLSLTFRPAFPLYSDHLRTVLAVKGSLRRAQQRRALDRSGPF